MKGYKVALKIDGKYYSTTTGIEYKENEKIKPVIKVSDIVKKQCISDFIPSDVIKDTNVWYDPDLVGRTKVFKKLDHAQVFIHSLIQQSTQRRRMSCVILYVETSDDILNKTFVQHDDKHDEYIICPIFLSDEFLSITECNVQFNKN